MIRVTVMAGAGQYSVFDHEFLRYQIKDNGVLAIFDNSSAQPDISYNSMAWLKVEDVKVPASSE